MPFWRSWGSVTFVCLVCGTACSGGSNSNSVAGNEPASSASETVDVPSPSGCGEEALDYESFGGPFFLDWCTGCHSSHLARDERQGAPVEVNFDTLDGIREYRDRILARAVEAKTMPPVGGPSDADRARLATWLDCDLPVARQTFSPSPPDSLMSVSPEVLGACAKPRDVLAGDVLPRCTAATHSCVAACAADSAEDDARSACRDACMKADPTPGVVRDGLPIDCSNCAFFQMMGCGSHNGCDVEVGELMCCLEGCIASGVSGCFERDCSLKLRAFAFCVGYGAPSCAAYDSGPIAECFATATKVD